MNLPAFHDALRYVDDWLTYQFPLMDAPSLSIAVSHNGEVVFAKALGDAESEAGRPATTDTPYRFASHTKMVTAVALLQLQEAGLLDLDDPVAMHLPWLGRHADSQWHSITARQLLSHAAGVARDGSASGFWTLQRPFPNRRELQQDILRQHLVIQPDSKMKYSNYGFGVLGMLVEAVSGKPYDAYVAENVIKKIGLERTSPDISLSSNAPARGYTEAHATGRQLAIDHCETGALAPATGLCSTPSDICRFIEALVSGTLITAASLEQMTHPQQAVEWAGDVVRQYGLGLEIGSIGNHGVYGHSGSFPGARSSTRHDPERHVTVSAVNNDTSFTSAMVVKSILAIIDWFDTHYVEKPAHDVTKFSARFGTLWGVSEILGYGDTLVELYPQLPLELENAAQLTRIDDTTVELTHAGSYSSVGERYAYTFDGNGTVTSARRSGATVLPLATFRKQLAKAERLRLP